MRTVIIVILLVALMVLIAIGLITRVELRREDNEETGTITVVTIGSPSSDTLEALSSKEARMSGIQYTMNYDQSFITPDMLKNFQVVILQGDPYFDMDTRTAIKDYVDNGGSIIVVGDAGSKHPKYANVAGWAWPSGEGIPVPAELIGEWVGFSDVTYGSGVGILKVGHPIAKGLKKVGVEFKKKSMVWKVVSKGKLLAIVETAEGTYPAIIEGGSGFGKVIYFAYDPGQTPNLLINSIIYASGGENS